MLSRHKVRVNPNKKGVTDGRQNNGRSRRRVWTIMTPCEFAKSLQDAEEQYKDDPEAKKSVMIAVVATLLRKLGYSQGATILERAKLW